MQSFRTCNKKHYFEYELGIRRENEGKPLRFGSVFHEALDQLAQGIELEAVITAVMDAYGELPGWCTSEEQITDWFVEAYTCATMVRGYAWRWQNEPIKVVETEHSFRIPLENPASGKESKVYDLAGKIDKIVEWRNTLAVMEHKTTSEGIEGDADYWKRLMLDPQISIYVIAARKLGHNVSTVLYDVVRKPTIAPKMVNDLDENGKKVVLDSAGNRVFKKDGSPRESSDTKKGFELQCHREQPHEFAERLLNDFYDRPNYYFQRREIPRLDVDIEDAAGEIWHMQKIIRECQRNDRWPRNTQACLKPYRCAFTDICFNGINPMNSLPDGFVRIDNVHPEL